MKLLILSLIFLSLLGQRPAKAQVDSAQWPFPDPFFMSCALTGNFTTNLDEVAIPNQQAIDSTWTIHHTSGVPEYGFPNDFFSWENVTTIDSVAWHLANQAATVTIAFDSASHTIFQLELNYNSDGGQPTESLHYTLHSLHYNDSTISCSDNDLWRHVSSAGYVFGDINDFENETTTFSGLDGFGFYSIQLTPGFLFPSKVDFGSQSVDSARDTTIVLQNLSDTALSIYSYELQDSDSGFSFIDTTAHSIAAQDSSKIIVRFVPHETKIYSGNVHIVTDEPYAPTYSIQLAGTAASSSVTMIKPTLTTLSVIPSMADAYISMQLPSDDGALSICNVLGQQIYSKDAGLYMNGNTYSIDTHSWPSGSYMATFTGKQGSTAAKFIVRH